MPNTKSAKKELRKSTRRAQHNKKIKDSLKNVTKKAKKAILAKDKKSKELVAEALITLDKAAQKGIIKKNTRNRKKSRLQKKLNEAFKS